MDGAASGHQLSDRNKLYLQKIGISAEKKHFCRIIMFLQKDRNCRFLQKQFLPNIRPNNGRKCSADTIFGRTLPDVDSNSRSPGWESSALTMRPIRRSYTLMIGLSLGAIRRGLTNQYAL